MLDISMLTTSAMIKNSERLKVVHPNVQPGVISVVISSVSEKSRKLSPEAGPNK
jgi:hypothetical protein